MDAKIRKVVSQLKKASQAHARQAAMLEKMIKSNIPKVFRVHR